jgi:hypothetical protein
MFLKWVVKRKHVFEMGSKKNVFLKWVIVGSVKVGYLPTPPENSAEGSVRSPCSSGPLKINKVTSI